ncbi:CUE domain-containing protein [Lasiosphaeria hispida]|uniref:Coupling of ubiquitin conjugation to ER degradation protein 1 n=1 Tax=Lasiosphaeria hispida TaxID=260671 RepID=A0AAJ0HIP1_9PEZI|nr:CUE domain-containing protein [Lasiosphaeria hispida]
MANEQVNVPSLLVILVLSGLIIRYLFFTSPAGAGASAASGRRGGGASQLAATLRVREAQVDRIQQMFPQADRRTVLWDLQRNGGNVAATTERILAGRMETPPITFQPAPPPGAANGASAAQSQSAAKTPEKPAQPDLITRYNLKDKITPGSAESPASEVASSAGTGSGSGSGKGKAWSSNREERQSLLQKRRDQMILEARRKMEAKMAAEKAVS